jgi:hypothetical protein
MAIESQGTTLEISTGSGVAKNITGVTLGAITKITSTAHGLAAGDVVAFASIGGTTELNGVKVMIVAVETNAFYVRINSTGYGAYTSGGTATPQTYTAVGEIIDWDGPGGSASVIDKTHLLSSAREKMIGLADEGQFNMSLNCSFTDVGQQAARAARAARAQRGFRVTYSDATVQTFMGYVLTFSTSGGVDDKVNAAITIEIDGAVATT